MIDLLHNPMFSGASIVVALGVMCVVLLVVRRRSQNAGNSGEDDLQNQTSGKNARSRTAANGSKQDRKSSARATTPDHVFGAFRIDQEVGKLVLGKTHRQEVLSSRATDDRRAVETSLMKFVTSSDVTEEERSRAREALETYGFVANHCASLLRATDAFERTYAARILGQIGSLAALPFLLESVYDSETSVRNQAIASLGSLKDPSAVRTLEEVSKKFPDIPAHIINRALNACEGNTVQADIFNPQSIFEITQLEPAALVDELAESATDQRWIEAVSKLESTNSEERMEAVKVVAEFPSKHSVNSLIKLTQNDAESSVRAQAVASLGSIGHPSVFPSVLLALADKSREVQAAAARSMSRLTFNRADAYVRLLQDCDETVLKNVASACVKAGIVSQNIDRLASCDRRQAYETFTLFCVLARAQMTETIVAAVSNHVNINVRLSVIHLLATTGNPEVFEQFQQLATTRNMLESVRMALLEAIGKQQLQTESKQSA